MKDIFIIANWKSNKTTLQTKEWFEEISNLKSQISNTTNKEIIICPSFTVISEIKKLIIEHNTPFKLGSQDISAFGEGAYTGEVNGKQLLEFVSYVIIGHSERRTNLNEKDEMLFKKVEQANLFNLKTIYCVQNSNTSVPQGIEIVAYEPVFAIGTGNPDTPENAQLVASEIKTKNPSVQFVLYGGSVDGNNVNLFTKQPNINGVLVGKASLDPLEFFKIIQNA